MVSSGSWACLENVERLGSGVLSILGEHLSTIITSLKCLRKFVFSQYTARGFSKTDRQKVRLKKKSFKIEKSELTIFSEDLHAKLQIIVDIIMAVQNLPLSKE